MERVPNTLMEFKNWKFSSGSVADRDFKVFARLFKKYIIQNIPSNSKLVNFNRGHYYVSGFIENGGKYVYFSISDVRYFHWYKNILIRTAETERDYTGGNNYYTTLDDFKQSVVNLMR